MIYIIHKTSVSLGIILITVKILCLHTFLKRHEKLLKKLKKKMTQPKTELETLETFMSKKRNVITNQ